MAYYGFDRSVYPTDAVMTAWRSQTPFKFCGFYLGPTATGQHSDNSWMTKRSFLKNLNWGFLVLYLGRQLNQTKTADLARSDAQDASNLAAQAGFPKGTIIYLDVEQGGLLPSDFITYITTWCAALSNAGTYLPGIYCSYSQTADQIKAALTVNTQFYVYHIGLASPSCSNPFPDPNSAPAPSTSGVSYAVAWQYTQNCSFTAAGYTLTSLGVKTQMET
ncbi:glycoside hydrolase domain-containing protein [Deinococcus sp. S9]|uniref:glycoside hydrolase domain-containing protein n=1 Tax=Deinococcus sp. S9 TaxID=2545754 RepID=UPI001055603C|nr:DUF1906 domain-containing protein [Deinococcus sp. S9]